jgi:hypothetical protein
MIQKIIENINFSQANKILDKYEFFSIVSKKWTNVLNETKNIKRLTEKANAKLIEIFEDDLFVSFAPEWGGHQPAYLSNYIHSEKYRPNGLADSIVHRHTMGICNELQRWHKELKNTDLFKTIDKQWSKMDSKYLELICGNYSDYIHAAAYLFYNIFKYDGRYDILYNYYHTENCKRRSDLKLNENVINYIIEGNTESDINIKFLDNYLEIKRFELNIPFGLALKTCKYSGNNYIEHFHISKYAYNHLYLPYYEIISGWTTNNSENKIIMANNLKENKALELLINFCTKIEGIPSVNDWNTPTYTPGNVKELHDIWVESPNSDYYKNKYGDFRAALIKANLVPESTINSKYGIMCISKDGHFCRSMAEQRIDNWLFKNNIIHEMEPYYPKHEEFNKSGRMRADWKIGNMFVEYFGLPDDKKYAERMQKKRSLANVLNINLIELFYTDLFDLDKSMRLKLKNIISL